MSAIESFLNEKKLALRKGKIFIVKFTADWCKPCRRIRHICLEWQQSFGSTAEFLEINIDDQIDLYSFFKRKRIIRGIPAILGWYTLDDEDGYWPQDSVCSGDTGEVISFFGRQLDHLRRKKQNNTIS